MARLASKEANEQVVAKTARPCRNFVETYGSGLRKSADTASTAIRSTVDEVVSMRCGGFNLANRCYP